jgi:hypothetical protein
VRFCPFSGEAFLRADRIAPLTFERVTRKLCGKALANPRFARHDTGILQRIGSASTKPLASSQNIGVRYFT